MKYKEFQERVASYTDVEIVDVIEAICEETDNQELFDHMQHVASLAVELAEHYKLNKNHAFLTGYLHDLGRLIDPDEYEDILKYSNIKVSDKEKSVYDVMHGKVATVISDEVFNIQEEAIHQAILYHTTLRKKPSDFEKIIFLADKMTWTFDDLVFNIEETVFQSLNIACYNALKWLVEHIEHKHSVLLDETLEAYLYFKGMMLL